MILRILALLTAVALILGVCFFVNALFGNPISEALAKNAAKNYVTENYADKDYELTEIFYSFKDGYYHAEIASKSSVDTHFTLFINGFGKIKYDNFDNVTNGWNTAQRLDMDYRKTVEALFNSNSFPYDEYIGFGELVFTGAEEKDNPTLPSYAMITNDLTLDAYYNVNELGRKAGKLTVCIDDRTVSCEKTAEMLLAIRDTFDKAGIGFYAIDFTLTYPVGEDGTAEDGSIEVLEFLYSDIYPEGMVERVKAANEAAKEFYSFLDKS